MFWLCVLGAAWGGFLLGVLFVAGWASAHDPETSVCARCCVEPDWAEPYVRSPL